MLETDVLSCSPATPAADWPEPTALPELETPDNEFPIDALGHILGNAVRAAQNANQAPLALNAQSFLAAANYSVQAHANIVRDGSRFPVSEFFLTLGETGERKSSCDKMALKPIDDFSVELAVQYESDYLIYKRRKAAWEAAQKSIERRGRGGKDQIEQELLALGKPPKPPLVPILKCADATVEGLYKSFLVGQPSQALFNDEAGQFLGGPAMTKENKLKGITTLSKLWDGAALERVRSTDEFTVVRDRRLSVHLMVQPSVIQDTLSDELINKQGLLARFLTAFPKSTIGDRPYKKVDLSQDQAYEVYCKQMESHLGTPPRLAQGTQNQLAPRDLSCDATAEARWTAFYNLIERELKSKGHYSGIKGFGAKAAEHCLRLAATLALFENLHASSISAEHIERASALVEFYLAEWLRLSGGLKPDGEEAMAGKLLDWLKTKKLDIVTVADITGSGPSCFRVSGAARQAVGCLMEYGWLKPAPPNIEVRGRKRREAFWVHPKILS
ncbi:MAG: DUF3987 domain-containing protein [Candidatus Obscuribacter sp.]|nr:DUF3987 domain-containing protein [Candidatus Obscuribacter sp.]